MRQHPTKHFEKNTRGRDLIIGDIHGHFTRAKEALDAVGFNPEAGDRLFSVGDLVDRGPESDQALEWLAKPWFHAVAGNHEDFAIRWPQGNMQAGHYVQNGGAWNVSNPPDAQAEFAAAFAALPPDLSVIAMSDPMLEVGDTTPEMYSADAKERKNAVEALNKLFRGADQKPAAAAQEPAIWPRNAAEVRQFMNANCEVEQYAVGPDTPDDNDRYQLTAHDFLGAVEWWTGYRSDSSHRSGNQPPEHDEDLLEQLYWEFDDRRQKTGEERLAFKGKMRFYASEVFKKAHRIGEAAE